MVAGRVGGLQAQVPAATGIDLRRHRRREEVEVVLSRVEYLPPSDRALLVAIFQGGQSAAQVARLLKVDARIVRRNVRLLTARVLAPEFGYVIRRRERWSRVRQQVGQLCFVEGVSLREAARAMSQSVYAVRRHCEWIRAGAAEMELEVDRRESA